ncbi:site-specific recombinase, phage integrase family [Acinetobacter sp. WC-323]|uniref:tyrosine-type recombinase/integrase n=1 Tax=Acinetobacter sp. WC-323 TaxID=903918 RepID=UPI00029E2AB2|nr:integrase family protein [Acinetobacter sp. WC-323]EKU55836.1 site-specific recombinase, phage integrase family [Acinetobacter sp. WC-323]
MKVKLTTSRVLKLEKPIDGKNQIFYWDLDTHGLALRVTNNDNRSYIFQGRIPNKIVRITIGDVNVWSLDEARIESRRLKQLCDQGIDPRRNKAEEEVKNTDFSKLESLKKITFGHVFKEYVEENKSRWSDRHFDDHIKLIKKGGEKKKRGEGLTIDGALHALVNTPLSQFSADYLVKWQKNESITRPGQTALAFRLARACINWCSEHDVYSQIIGKNVHQTKRVRKAVPVLKARKRALLKDQLSNWFLAVSEVPNIMHRTFLQITILTGPRSDSLRSIEKEHLDFKWKVIMIWDKDDQDYRSIPMTSYVEKLLKSLPQNPDSKYVFWSTKSKCGYITDVRKKYHEKLDEYGLPHLSIHDLRRSFSNLTEWLDIPQGVVAQIMGHKPSATQEKHYKDRPVDLLRVHHQRIEDWILQEANISVEPSLNKSIDK